MLKVVAFDFGGVLAEEGFANGLRAIAARNGLEGESFLETARELIYETGYVTGTADEHLWWEALRESTAVKGSDEELRQEILSRFVLRPAVLQEVRRLKRGGPQGGHPERPVGLARRAGPRIGFYGPV